MTDRQRQAVKWYRWAWVALAVACVPTAFFRYLQVSAFPGRMTAYSAAIKTYTTGGKAAEQKFLDARVDASRATAVHSGKLPRNASLRRGPKPKVIGPIYVPELDEEMQAEFPGIRPQGPLPTPVDSPDKWHVRYVDAATETAFYVEFEQDVGTALQPRAADDATYPPPPLKLKSVWVERTAPPPVSPAPAMEAYEMFATDVWFAAALGCFVLVLLAAYREEGRRQIGAWAALALVTAVVVGLSCSRGRLPQAAFLALATLIVIVASLLWNVPALATRAMFCPRETLVGEPRHLCIGCGYDLTGNHSGRCPECGMPSGRLSDDRLAELVRSTARLSGR